MAVSKAEVAKRKIALGLGTGVVLRPYQDTDINAIEAAWLEFLGVIYQLPTGGELAKVNEIGEIVAGLKVKGKNAGMKLNKYATFI